MFSKTNNTIFSYFCEIKHEYLPLQSKFMIYGFANKQIINHKLYYVYFTSENIQKCLFISFECRHI